MLSLRTKAKKIFVDSLRIKVKGGTGGHGLPQYGGIGGKGGDVYIQGFTKNVDLDYLQKRNPTNYYQAGDGKSARRTRLVGEPGRDMIIRVPIGVSIQDHDRQFIGDINEPTDRVLVALGGRGGDKHNDNHGFVGQKRTIKLDLKLISDAVFVGFPNAGKSSLLRVISNAFPKVADYPFTTLKPNLGMVEYTDFRQITFADLPGLVEGAHKNLGLGHEFIKHMVRTRLLVFVVDINHVDLGPSYSRRSPFETLCILNKEIELYDDTILNKPAILVLSKMDSVRNAKERYEEFKRCFDEFKKDPQTVEESIRPKSLIDFDRILPISSESGLNIGKLKDNVREVIDEFAETQRQQIDKISTYSELQPTENNRIINQ